MVELAVSPDSGWMFRFTVMLTLSVVVAVMGLSAGSAAVVIGAMLLAPLMTPVLAAAATIAMSLFGRSVAALLRVLFATLWCVATAYLISWILPDGPLSAEIEARTRPDIRDLVVALAAGAAGAYATVRRDASAALPGVAVAVALVPPLATVGITLEAEKYDMAMGAVLLYITNLAAIVFAGVMVFIATGFVPPRRLANTAVRLVLASGVAAGIVIAITVPLYSRSVKVVQDVRDEVAAGEVVEFWLNGARLDARVDVTEQRVLVRLQGFEAPPDDATLKDAMAARLGDVPVVVEWVRTERATTTTARIPTDNELLAEKAEPVVQEWLAANKPPGTFDVQRVIVNAGVVQVNAAGSGHAPSVDDLLDRLQAEVDPALTVRMNWTERQVVDARTTTTVASETILQQDMMDAARQWAEGLGVDVEWLEFSDNVVEVRLSGERAPITNSLVRSLESIASEPITVEVIFTQRQRLTTLSIPELSEIPGLEGQGFGANLGPATTTIPAPTATTTTTSAAGDGP